MYQYVNRIRFSEVDQNRKITLNAILNYFQDCVTFQSEDLDVGMSRLEPMDRMWVLSSWEIEVYRYPAFGERITVETWPYDFGKMTGQRNFRMRGEDGSVAACADSLWVYMDTKRMRPARLDSLLLQTYRTEPGLDMGHGGKIALPADMEEKDPFPIHEYHLDVNHHVNNGQYVRLAGDYLPEGFAICRMRAEYKRSAVLGDVIYPRIGKTEDGYVVLLGDEKGTPYAAVEFRQGENTCS